ncbi:hypothetical protein ACWKWZ_19785 [Metapseudomonas otitidis]|jgi:hypothetical protein|uniref:Uncharacterized protein n=1 Tax=Metapseudomonas otitidis TaxID=319939 RepID=A0A7X3KWL8_9GAMM|nr:MULTISPECIES: hypothetical protein [Pseudomonas]MDL5601839.1 hypothetical protein [Bacillus subtilis]KIV60438.1 hypothetical protein SZ55_5343 [Pseudomonas sp. FeS53a]MCP1620769.1 hypothetical protein [Pseudomonas otitidis]MDH0335083.1 hypothetical protein [Pseudomonas otitidis]MDI6524541.1 hypothetical protein [Pseudomonas otitidis]
MSKGRSKVVHLHERDPEEALERLNRITGLRFTRWPESLVPPRTADDALPVRPDESTPPTSDAARA